MTINRTYRTELDPNKEQRQKLYQFAGAVRFVYNWALDQKIKAYESDKKTLKQRDLQPILQTTLRAEHPWLADVSSYSLLAALQNSDRAFENFFRRIKQKSEAPGFPRFKSKHKRIGGFKMATQVNVKGRTIRLPNIGFVRLKEKDYLPQGVIKIRSGSVTEKAGRWFVTVTVEEERTVEPATQPPLGVDLGIKSLAVCSDGTEFHNSKLLVNNLKRLKRLQRKLNPDRQQKGSNRRFKTKRRIAKLHFKIAEQRRYALHQISHHVTAKTKPMAVGIEDLNVKGMVKNRHLAQAISDAAFGELRRQIEYKAQWYGVKVAIADRFYPSSKTCSNCGFIKQLLKLSERTFHCENCGFSIDRDLNAARNLAAFAQATGNLSESNGRGESGDRASTGNSRGRRSSMNRQPRTNGLSS